MKQSPVGELVMDREQLRGCSQSLLMQEVRRRELSSGFSPNTGQRTRVVYPLLTHFLMWMAPLPHTFTRG